MEKSKIPTLAQAESTPHFYLSTKFTNGEYVAQCVVNGQVFLSNPKAKPGMAIDALVKAIVEMKAKEGKKRGLDYIFTTNLP